VGKWRARGMLKWENGGQFPAVRTVG